MRCNIASLGWCLLLIFLSSCAGEYRDHYGREHTQRVTLSSEMSAEESSPELWIFPDSRIKSELITMIASAQKRIWIEIYTWTDKDIVNAVIAAHNRGVDVQIVLEGNVYGTPSINAGIFRTLKMADIPVTYADNYRYSFTHAKFFIIDDVYIISTGNLTKSLFTSNRDIMLLDSAPNILSALEAIFLSDSSHRSLDMARIPDRIVISPLDARAKIMTFIASAKDRIELYVQTVADPAILELLAQKQSQGVSVKVCTALNDGNITASSGTTLLWSMVKKPYLHAKVVFIDGERIFLGSQNFTDTALDKNREIGVFLHGKNAPFSTLHALFEGDCQF